MNELRHNLTDFETGFVGRRKDIIEVGKLLRRSRLVSITGLGGMGKTRLAVEVARRALPRFDDGVWLIDLASITDPTVILGAVATAIPMRDRYALPASPNDVARQIGDQSLLIVLDNCEHLVAACAEFVRVLLRSCPSLHVLATSREPLGVESEHVWPLGALSLPRRDRLTVRAVTASEAGKLFVERATVVRPEFRLTKDLASTVSEICWRLDGMPLAIELAAGRLVSLPADDIRSRLDDRFALFDEEVGTGNGRHGTLGAVLEWSHDLLTPAEAVLFRRLSIFPTFTLAAAEEVCVEAERTDVLDTLGDLVRKSLVVYEAGDSGARYRLLETVRLWASAKLTEAGEDTAIHRRHALWCLAQAEREPDPSRPSPLADLEAEHDNFRVALEWLITNGEVELGLRLATALSTFWRLGGHVREGACWLERVVGAGDGAPPMLRARALRGLGLLRGMQGDVKPALAILAEASALFATAGDLDAAVCAGTAMFTMFSNPRQALPQIRADVERCRRTDDTEKLAHLFGMLGKVHYVLGELSEARYHYEKCVEVARSGDDGEALRFGLIGLADTAFLEGDYAQAEAWIEETAWATDESVCGDDITAVLGVLGDVARARGEWDRSRQLLDRSVESARAGGGPQALAKALYLTARLVECESDGSGREPRVLLEQARSLSGSVGKPAYLEVRCLLGLGSAAEADGDLGAAAEFFGEALDRADASGDLQGAAQAYDRLGWVARAEGRLRESRRLVHLGLERYHSVGDIPSIVASLEALGGLEVDGGHPERAAILFGAVEAVRQRQGYARPRREQLRYEDDLARAQEGSEPEAFTAAWSQGAALTIDEAVSFARRGRGARNRPLVGWDSLTPAEIEVVRLVGEGLAIFAVARRLAISVRTVNHHLGRVYRKLNIHSRGELTEVLAARGGIDP